MEAGIVIVGAGISGLATALGLHRLGLQSLVLEASDTLRMTGYTIVLWTNAWRALEALGVSETLREQHVRLEQIIFSSAISGSITSQLPITGHGKSGQHEARCVRRNTLVDILAKELPNGTIRFSSKVVSIEEIGDLKLLHLADGSTIKAKVLIGCDGINSVVSKWLGLEKPVNSGRTAARGCITFEEGHGFNPSFSFCFGKGYRSGLVPWDDKSVYWFFTYGKEILHDSAEMEELIKSKIKTGKFPEKFLRIIERIDFREVSCTPMQYRSPFSLLHGNISRGSVCVVGDAFHPLTPDIGQGGCSALEDSVILSKCLHEAFSSPNRKLEGEYVAARIEAALRKYAFKRRWRSIKLTCVGCILGLIQESANPVIMFLRDKVLSPWMAREQLYAAEFDCGKLSSP